MKADQIRGFFKDDFLFIARDSAATAFFLCEIAAQLAELNEPVIAEETKWVTLKEQYADSYCVVDPKAVAAVEAARGSGRGGCNVHLKSSGIVIVEGTISEVCNKLGIARE